jgi:hypothetical protein
VLHRLRNNINKTRQSHTKLSFLNGTMQCYTFRFRRNNFQAVRTKPLKHTSSTDFALQFVEMPLKKHDKLFIILSHMQWCTQEFCLGGDSTNSVEDRENGDLGAVAP